jgi:hypothetical protein
VFNPAVDLLIETADEIPHRPRVSGFSHR